MMKVFLDTNILLDFIGDRTPFNQDAKYIFQLADTGVIDAYVSDLSIINGIYILRRMHLPLDEIYDAMNLITQFVHITSIGERIVKLCLAHRNKDLEDEAQYLSSKTVAADYLITRNIKDYPFADNVVEPQDFLKLITIN